MWLNITTCEVYHDAYSINATFLSIHSRALASKLLENIGEWSTVVLKFQISTTKSFVHNQWIITFIGLIICPKIIKQY